MNIKGKKTFTPDWRDITTFEKVCEVTGENPKDYEIPDNATKRQRGKILYSMYELVCDALKGDVVLDPTNISQPKYYLFGEYRAGSGFSLDGVDCVITCSVVGARLSVDTEGKATHMWKYFSHIIIQYWEGK